MSYERGKQRRAAEPDVETTTERSPRRSADDASADAWARRDWSFQGFAQPIGSAVDAAVVQREGHEGTEIADEIRDARDEGRSIRPSTVDRMILGTDSIRGFVEGQISRGIKADGRTYFYASRAEYAEGMAKHWGRFELGAAGEPSTKTDAQVLREARAKADETVAATLIDGDGTIHINLGDGEHEFRTILHEAMHQQMQLHAANLGMDVGEGFAEFLSEIVLENYGIDFQVAGVNRTQYEFVQYLAGVFGKDAMIRCALADGERAFKKEFLAYAKDAAVNWDLFLDHVRERRYGRAKAILSDNMVPLREYLRPQDEQAERATDEFWDEADQLEKELQDARDRTTWPPEASESIEARVVAVGQRGLFGILTIPRGGRHGVREGWWLEFGTDSDFFPERYLVTEVENNSCRVLVTRPFDQVQGVGGQSVTLRKS